MLRSWRKASAPSPFRRRQRWMISKPGGPEVYEHARPTLLRALAASIGSFEGVEDAAQDAVADAISQQKTDVRSPEGWL